MNPQAIRIEDYNYQLPAEQIADFPAPDRDQSRLLVYRESITEDVFSNLPNYLPTPGIIVFNNSKVVEARLLFRKSTGATIEIFCLEPDARYPDITTAFAQTREVYWKCFVGNSSGWPHGTVLTMETNLGPLHAKMTGKQQDHFEIQLSWSRDGITFSEILHEAGAMPLPPYIKRKPNPSDNERYQTIYAAHEGSVAAPTAGLHFTPRVIEQLKSRSIQPEYITLHVGAGTFKPVKSDKLEDHQMHSELIEVERSLLEKLHDNKDPVVAVGTTSLRTLESLYWIGVLLHNNPDLKEIPEVTQWIPYESQYRIDSNTALSAVLNWMKKNDSTVMVARTSLLIAPGYNFQIVSVLITNFHQPKSTLLLLIAAFIGEEWKSVYTYALEKKFRFLSYGDSCLLFRRLPSL